MKTGASSGTNSRPRLGTSAVFYNNFVLTTCQCSHHLSFYLLPICTTTLLSVIIMYMYVGQKNFRQPGLSKQYEKKPHKTSKLNIEQYAAYVSFKLRITTGTHTAGSLSTMDDL